MNITYIYTPISCCSTSIWHHLSRGTVYMPSKWHFRWKIRAIAFYLRRLGFKALIRSQVNISLVLSSFLTFVYLTQPLLVQALSDLTRSHCSKGGFPGLQRRRVPSVRDSGVLTWIWRKKGNVKEEKKKQGRTQSSHWFLAILKVRVFSVIPTLFLKVPTSMLRSSWISDI